MNTAQDLAGPFHFVQEEACCRRWRFEYRDSLSGSCYETHIHRYHMLMLYGVCHSPAATADSFVRRRISRARMCIGSTNGTVNEDASRRSGVKTNGSSVHPKTIKSAP